MATDPGKAKLVTTFRATNGAADDVRAAARGTATGPPRNRPARLPAGRPPPALDLSTTLLGTNSKRVLHATTAKKIQHATPCP